MFGKIYGKIPQYISIDNGKNYEKVTSLYSTFKKCTQLKVAPEIPETIKEMFCAFSQTGVTKAPIIPKNVENLAYCFEVTPIIENFEKSIFDDSKDIIGDYLEIGIDSIIDNGILKEIPIVKTIVGVLKVGKNVHDRNLLKQTLVFINEFNRNEIRQNRRI